MPPLSKLHEDNIPRLICSDTSSSHSSCMRSASRAKKPISPDSSKRVVKFAPKVHAKPTISIVDYTDAERNATWFTIEEMSAIKHSRRSTVRIMERGDPLVNNGQHYFRGLESKTKEGSRRKQFNQVDAVMAVLDEQDVQERNDVHDIERIAKLYRECTFHCGIQAHARGMKDQQAALESLSEPCIVAPPVAHMPMRRRLSCQAA